MNTPRSVWRRLKIEPTRDIAAIRSAYAAVLKSIDPDTDRAGFEALREAREQALAFARRDDGAVIDDEAATSHDIAIPLGAYGRGNLDAPILGDNRPRGDVTTTVPPAAEELFQTFERPASTGGQGRVIPLHGLNDALVIRVLGLSRVSSMLENSPLTAPESFDEHYRAVLSILFGEDGQFVRITGNVADILRNHVAALLRDPRMAEIAFYADAERWFAQIVSRGMPRSDVILAPVIEHFGWLASRGRIDQSTEIAAVVARHDSLVFLAAVGRPQHPLFVAWNELTRPANERSHRDYSVSRKKVNELLEIVRRDYPDLEQAMDWYRVSLWENPTSISSRLPGGFYFLLTWVIIFGLGSLGYCSPSQRRPSYISPPPALILDELVSPDDDINAALRDVANASVSMHLLREKKPSLAAMLEAKWQKAKELKQGRDAFLRDTTRLLFQRYRNGLRRADHALISQYRQLDLDEAKAALEAGSVGCSSYFQGGYSPGPRSVEFGRRNSEIIVRVLTELDTDPPRGPVSRMFTIKGAVVDASAIRAGMTRTRFLAAMDEMPSSLPRCRTRIALLETALALPPKDGLKLLRDM
ncbi:hypothetical protein U1769_08145 [Sphingomonas sp. ZT3P38]|uniref:hypothetical protein n=1 Tax=Parasphingomonas zepuensis TaxID=3096161 RepID=UPI002FC7C5F1